MQKKRGQLTIFILIGVLLLFAVSGVFFLITSSAKTSMDENVDNVVFSSNVQPLRHQITNCLDLELNKALTKFGKNGGFINPPYQSLGQPRLTEGAFFTYFYKKTGENAQPVDLSGQYPEIRNGVLNWEQQLSNYIEENNFRKLRECLDGLVFYRDRGYDIEEGDISLDLRISEKAVTADLTYPLKLTLDGKKAELSKFTTVYPVDLLAIRTEALALVANKKQCEKAIYDSLSSSLRSCSAPNQNSMNAQIDVACSYQQLSPDLEIVSINFNHTAIIKATFVKKILLIEKKFPIHEAIPSPYETLIGILDKGKKDEPFTFLMATLINYDMDLGTIKC